MAIKHYFIFSTMLVHADGALVMCWSLQLHDGAPVTCKGVADLTSMAAPVFW